MSWENIVDLVGIIGGLFAIGSIIRSQLWPARVDLRVADTVELVIGTDGIISSFHLACSFENHGARTGTIQRMEAKIMNPHNEVCKFGWLAFLGYRPGGTVRERLKDRHAIAVRQNDTEFVMILFESEGGCRNFRWSPGEYTFEISAWVNAEKPIEDPHIQHCFRASVTPKLASQAGKARQQPVFWAIEISDWAPGA